MTHYALIGHPLGHSLSPQIHRALLAAAHLEGDYRLLDIAPEDLANRLPELQTLRGFNVTIPHKQAVLSAMAELDEKAALFGAVNTVANSTATIRTATAFCAPCPHRVFRWPGGCWYWAPAAWPVCLPLRRCWQVRR